MQNCIFVDILRIRKSTFILFKLRTSRIITQSNNNQQDIIRNDRIEQKIDL